MDDDDFDDIVSSALDAIPDALADLIDNVVVVVEDEPGPDDPVDDGGDLLGLYEGTDLTSRSAMDPGFVLPDRITVFRGPHLRAVRSRRELRRLVTETVVHEIAHHFGIDDERLDELGWA